MDTYFIRHTDRLDVDERTMDRIIAENRIAIHYPGDIGSGKQDSVSLDPDDYSGTARSIISRFKRLSEVGGYVFVLYRGRRGAKVGIVKPKSKIEILEGKWGTRRDRIACLKTIQLNSENLIELDATDAIKFLPAQPRLGTFCQWHAVGTRVERLFNSGSAIELGELTPDLQEVMCMEFLRTDVAERENLPKLISTLSPVGRTLKDLDILGVSNEGKSICAQVTFANVDSKTVKSKLTKLDPYLSESSVTVMFCSGQDMKVSEGHIIYPLEKVFEKYCEENEQGKEWLKKVLLQ